MGETCVVESAHNIWCFFVLLRKDQNLTQGGGGEVGYHLYDIVWLNMGYYTFQRYRGESYVGGICGNNIG